MLASAKTDAKRNFFIQCSWENRKWESVFSQRDTPEPETFSLVAADNRSEDETRPRLQTRYWKDYRKPRRP
jgi:hypothetical protein